MKLLQETGGWMRMTSAKPSDSTSLITGSLAVTSGLCSSPSTFFSFHLLCDPTEPLTVPFAPGLPACSGLCFLP